MNNLKVKRSIKEPVRENLTWSERWKETDKGLINCWEIGRKLAIQDPVLAEKAIKGELPILNWKGGVDKKIQNQKHGSLQYLAQWQGIRGEDLNIDANKEIEITCIRYNQDVIFSAG
ncbi:MAG: hypothetical protein WD016_08970 [Balneolaceae bacterium]